MPPADGNPSDPKRSVTERAQRYVPRPIRRTTRGFALVLALLISIYVVAEVWEDSGFVQGLVWTLAFLAFVVTLRALNTAPRTVYINATLMALLAILAAVGLVTDQDYLTEPAAIAVMGYAFVAPVLILREVIKRHQVTMDVIFGALAIYVFLGIDFAVLYDIIQRVDPSAFTTTGPDSVFYLSFMTLTTVGYGDITPVVGWAQALTVVEALMGQILLVVIVARLVGMQIYQDIRPDRGSGETDNQ